MSEAIGGSTKRVNNRATLVSVILTLLAGLAAWLIPAPTHWSGTVNSFHEQLVQAVLFTGFYLSAGALFLIGVGVYKEALRRAYRWLVAGIALSAISHVQIPLFEALNMVHSAWATRGGIALPFILAGIAIYLGVRKLARLIGVQTILAKPLLILLLLVAGIAIVAVLPHSSHTILKGHARIGSIGSTVWGVVIYGVCAVMVLRVKNRIGAHYTNAMVWLFFSLASIAVVALEIVLSTLISGQSSAILTNSASLVSSLIFLKAGYAFAATREV